MGNFTFIVLLAIGVLLFLLIFPFWAMSSISKLRYSVERLSNKVRKLEAEAALLRRAEEASEMPLPADEPPVPLVDGAVQNAALVDSQVVFKPEMLPENATHEGVREATEVRDESAHKDIKEVLARAVSETSVVSDQENAFEFSAPEPAPISRKKPLEEPADEKDAATRNMEWNLGARLPVWLGAIALILSAFFMLRYSLQQGWFGPLSRCVLGGVSGVILTLLGNWVFSRPGIVSRERLGMALAGTGTAVLFGTLYALTSLYFLIPAWLGLLGMAAVTGLCVWLSLRMGEPIALLGLAGGILAPAFIAQQGISDIMFLCYLILFHAGILYLCRRRGYFLTSAFSIAGVLGWLTYRAFLSDATPPAVLPLFLLGDSGLVTWALWRAGTSRIRSFTEVARDRWALLGLGSVLFALMFTGGYVLAYPFMSWNLGYLFVFAAGAMVLAWFREHVYLPAAYAAAVLLWIALSQQIPVYPESLATDIGWLFGYVALFTIGGGILLRRSSSPVHWTPLVLVSLASAFGLAVYHYYDFFSGITACYWAAGAAGWGLVVFLFAPFVAGLRDDEMTLNAGRAFAWTGAAAFLWANFLFTYGITLTPVIQATLVLASILRVRFSRQGVRLLRDDRGACDHVPLLFLAGLFFSAASGLVESSLLLATGQEFGNRISSIGFSEMVHVYVVPCAMLFAARFLKKDLPTLVLQMLDGLLVVFLLLAAVRGVQGLLEMSNRIVRFEYLAQIAMTSICFVVALGILWLSRNKRERHIDIAVLVVAGVAVWRVAFLDVIFSPYLSSVWVGEWPVFNWLLPAYVLPIFWLSLLLPHIRDLVPERVGVACRVFSLVLLFMLATLEVRQYYHPGYLDTPGTSEIELYTYSPAWLLLSLSFLVVGMVRKSRSLRFASLALMGPTVLKIFLYDASALTGLLRAFSFLGLGLSLLLIGWFYSQFVFREQALNAQNMKASLKNMLHKE